MDSAETWTTAIRLEKLLHGCNSRMSRYMSHVKWDDSVLNEEVRRCGVNDVVMEMKKHQPRWYRYVQKKGKYSNNKWHGSKGRKPPGTPRKR